ncbi:MAG: hypothetical protein P4L83_19150 [Nevskia sp.]|nr:hypothetical protein [Nevskia sp.]
MNVLGGSMTAWVLGYAYIGARAQGLRQWQKRSHSRRQPPAVGASSAVSLAEGSKKRENRGDQPRFL